MPNKADIVDHQQLMRVYGALMLSLSKILGTLEVARVYIGSFWDQYIRSDYHEKMLTLYFGLFFADMTSIGGCLRRGSVCRPPVSASERSAEEAQ